MFRRSCTLLNNHHIQYPIALRIAGGSCPNLDKAKNVLGVAGGPSAWFQAFNHLQEDPKNSVVFFRPPGAPALWESSGRQISCREKVTKFVRLQTAVKSIVLKNTHIDNIGILAKLGSTFFWDRVSDKGHDDVAKAAAQSLASYRRLNGFLVSLGEKKIWMETGRLVIAGEKENHSLYKKVHQWRTQKGMVSSEESSRRYLGLDSKSAAESDDDDRKQHPVTLESSQRFLKDNSPNLFKPGYTGYPLDQGGYVVRDADEILFRAFTKYYGGGIGEGNAEGIERFTVVGAALESIVAHKAGGYHLQSANTEGELEAAVERKRLVRGYPTEVGKLFLSPGATPVMIGAGKLLRSRLAPPMEITGHSGVIIQKLTKDAAEKILHPVGCENFDEFFATRPASFMTDDFELTLENTFGGKTSKWAPTLGRTPRSYSSPSGGNTEGEQQQDDYIIRWRCTGNAHINTTECTANPTKTLLAPVQRFLAGAISVEGADDPSSHSSQRSGGGRGSVVDSASGSGFKCCVRQVGPTVREQIIPFGSDGKVALNWGHMGVTLAGIEL